MKIKFKAASKGPALFAWAVAGVLAFASQSAYCEPVQVAQVGTVPANYRQELRTLWETSIRHPELLRTRELLKKIDEKGVDTTAFEELTRLTGIVPSDGNGATNRLQAWKRYRGGLDVLLETQGSILINLDQDHAERGKAARFLGIEAPHPVFLPLLRHLAKSAWENYYLRCSALTAISQIPQQGVLGELIEFLDDADLRMRAWEQLEKLTRAGARYSPDPAGMRTTYERWIEKEGARFRYERERVLVER